MGWCWFLGQKDVRSTRHLVVSEFLSPLLAIVNMLQMLLLIIVVVVVVPFLSTLNLS